MLDPSVFRKTDFNVVPIEQRDCEQIIRRLHYAKGCSHTSTFRYGLIDRHGELVGATLWLPTTKPASQVVDRQWRQVISLSRMVVADHVPKNACSFMLGRAVKAIIKDGRYRSFVTYADEWKGHEGGVYLASNWIPTGYSQPTPKWVDADGRQIAQQSTKTRTVKEMQDLGYKMIGRFRKRRFVLYPGNDLHAKLLRLEAHLCWLRESINAKQR